MLDVAVPLGVQVQEERRQGTLDGGAGTARDAEPGTGELAGTGEVEDAEGLAEVHVVLRLEGEGRRRADATDLDGVLVGVALGGAVERQVGNGQQEVAQLLLHLLLLRLGRPDLFLELAGPVLQRLGVAALSGRLLDPLGDPLRFGPQLVHTGDELGSAGLKRLQRREIQGVAAAGEVADRLGAHLDEGAGIMHGSSSPPAGQMVHRR